MLKQLLSWRYTIGFFAAALMSLSTSAWAAPSVSAGSFHSLMLRDDGSVWSVGSNNLGQLGVGTTSNHNVPVQVKGASGVGTLGDVLAISAGDYFNLALRSDGTVWSWGQNNEGQLGDGTKVDRSTPVQVKGQGGIGALTNVVGVAASQYHALAVKSDGTVWAWGRNLARELGDLSTVSKLTPVQVRGPGGTYLSSVVSVATGGFRSFALKSDGTVWAWGANHYGGLGVGANTGYYASATQVWAPSGSGYLSGISYIAAGNYHTVAVGAGGSVWTWGRNDIGQLGDGSSNYQSALPVQVRGTGGSGFLSDVVSVSATTDHTVAILADGTVRVWGRNGFGSIGNGTPWNTNVPLQTLDMQGVGPFSGATSVAAGGYHTLAVSSGVFWSWGRNTSGQLGDGTGSNHYLPVWMLL